MEVGIINESTLVPISAFVTVGGVIVWVTRLYGQTKQNTKDIAAVWTKIDHITSEFNSLSERMARIEAKIDILLESIKH